MVVVEGVAVVVVEGVAVVVVEGVAVVVVEGVAVVVVVGWTVGQRCLHPQSVEQCDADGGKRGEGGSRIAGDGWDRAAG